MLRCLSQLFMKRNSVYVAFILGGALLGERVRSETAPLLAVTLATKTFGCWNNILSFRYPMPQVVDYGFNTAWERNNQGVRLHPTLSPKR